MGLMPLTVTDLVFNVNLIKTLYLIITLSLYRKKVKNIYIIKDFKHSQKLSL